jgi:hypothetical protein
LECILNQVDPQFEANQVFLYRLSIVLCPDGCSFLVTHSISNKVLKMSVYRLSDADFEHSEMGGWPVNENDYKAINAMFSGFSQRVKNHEK